MYTQAHAAGGAPHLRKRDQDMFGKARDIHDPDTLDTSALDEFFGDGAAAENTVEIHELRDRVEQVEAQISSQFTSLATYAQIAQEQVELARSEAKAATERSEQRLTSLIERERADRITSYTGVTPIGASEGATEHSSKLPRGSTCSSNRSPSSRRVSTSAANSRRTSRTRSPQCSTGSPSRRSSA